MSDQSLGRDLRAAIERQRRDPGEQVDPRRLESGLAALVTPDQQSLLPALSYLLRSPLVARLLSQPAELNGARGETLVTALRQELRALYTPALCNRLEAVLAGLLGLRAALAPAQVPAPAPVPAPAAPAVASTPEVQPPTRARGQGPGPLVAVLSFLVGILGGALVLLWLQRQPLQPTPEGLNGRPRSGDATQAPGRSAPVPPAPALPADDSTGGSENTNDTAEPAEATSEPAVAIAIATVEKLYAALNARDTEAARRLFGAAAADQFDPAFFNQFSRISVADLRATAETGTQIVLEGLVTFVYPDGTSQIETRSFTVESASDPSQIVASSFGQVIQAR